jgi:hypothetical protein
MLSFITALKQEADKFNHELSYLNNVYNSNNRLLMIEYFQNDIHQAIQWETQLQSDLNSVLNDAIKLCEFGEIFNKINQQSLTKDLVLHNNEMSDTITGSNSKTQDEIRLDHGQHEKKLIRKPLFDCHTHENKSIKEATSASQANEIQLKPDLLICRNKEGKSYNSQTLMKTIKAYFNNYTLDKMNFMLRQKGKSLFIIKLPNYYAITINSIFNKQMFNKTIEQQYSNFELPLLSKDPLCGKQAQHNKQIFSNINLPVELIRFIKRVDVYEEFISTDYFESICEQAKVYYSERYERIFRRVAYSLLKKVKEEIVA